MVKTVKIGSKEYNLKSSAFTMFSYKNETGRDLLKDLEQLNTTVSKINKLSEEEQASAWLTEFTPIIEKALKITHIMIKEQDKSFMEYEEWLKDIDCLFNGEMSWITEVIEVAIAPFFGRIQNSQNRI